MQGIIVAVFATGIFGAAWMLRYEPLPSQSGGSGFVTVWDRWTHQACLSVRPEMADVDGIACSDNDIQTLTGKIAGYKPNDDKHLSNFLSANNLPLDGAKAEQRLRAAGFTQQEIKSWAQKIRRQMRSSGVPPDEINRYFNNL